MKRKNSRWNRLGWAMILVFAASIAPTLPARSENREATSPGTVEGFTEATSRGSDGPAAGNRSSLAIGCAGVLGAAVPISAGALGSEESAGPNKGGNALDSGGDPTSRWAESGAGPQAAEAALRNNFFVLIAEIVD